MARTPSILAALLAAAVMTLALAAPAGAAVPGGWIDGDELLPPAGAAEPDPAPELLPPAGPRPVVEGRLAALGAGGVAYAPSKAPHRVKLAVWAANQLRHKPYRWGGGHRGWRDSGYDCSGAVSYVLHAAGVLDAPMASGAFMSYGMAGPGRWITIYANEGHMFMTINGRRFDTGYGGNGNRWASSSRPTAGYVVRHPPGL